MDKNHSCHYCGYPATHLYTLIDPAPGKPERIYICSVRTNGAGFTRIILPWTRCRRWAEADGYRFVTSHAD